ncbi:META and DUF4377 domain-containing protein [Acinetobacter sp. YH12027]|uniref:META and DUF4377 domain-containing protein n=1 Tax=Acinetobacter sp. YH12027 TaxID=2601043 RepID=UPI0015D34C59|nr:META and DUF4377 domain-containing protein [Acinetobacter sp. YH12027]
MKLKYLAIALFPLALAACQSSDIQKAGDLAVSVLKQQNADKTLASYQWSTTTENAPKPLVLNFLENGTLGISTSCNSMSTQWKVEHNTLVTGNIASTMMACPDNAMKQEGLASSLFSDRKTPFVLNTTDPQNPTLTIISATGEKLVFTGKLTPETQYNSQGETIFLEVSPETKQCTGVAPQTCLQVREVKYDEKGLKTQVDKDWTLFYDQIEGFKHTPAERQIIRVKRFERKNPAADQSKYAYIFDMSVEREAVKGTL